MSTQVRDFRSSICHFRIICPRLIALTLVLSGCQALAQSYGTYTLFPQGSARAMALGGANVSILDDATAMIFNPAGAALGEWQADFGGTDNKVDNRELSANFPQTYGSYETDYDSPYSYLFYSAAFRIGTWVIGAGYSQPFFNNYSYINPLSQLEIERAEVKVRSFDVLLAKSFGPNFAIGIAGHAESVTETYRNSSLTGSVAVGGIQTSGQGTYFSVGATFRTDSFGLGISHHPERRITVDKTGDDTLTVFNTEVFRDTVTPAKFAIGAFIAPTDWILITLDYDQYSAAMNTVYVSAVNTSYQLFKEKGFGVVHGGVEVKAYEHKWFELFIRGGAYHEPTRFEGGQDRDHITYGLEARLGPVIYVVSQDVADEFNNFSQSLSASLKDF